MKRLSLLILALALVLSGCVFGKPARTITLSIIRDEIAGMGTLAVAPMSLLELQSDEANTALYRCCTVTGDVYMALSATGSRITAVVWSGGERVNTPVHFALSGPEHGELTGYLYDPEKAETAVTFLPKHPGITTVTATAGEHIVDRNIYVYGHDAIQVHPWETQPYRYFSFDEGKHVATADEADLVLVMGTSRATTKIVAPEGIAAVGVPLKDITSIPPTLGVTEITKPSLTTYVIRTRSGRHAKVWFWGSGTGGPEDAITAYHIDFYWAMMD